jgi:mucin-2
VVQVFLILLLTQLEFTFIGNQPCDDDTATVTVTINPIPDAGENNSANICSNQDPVDLFTYILGTPQIGGEWTPTLASGTNIFNPAIDVSGNYTYSVGNPFCPPDSSIITVTITSGPEAGSNATPQDLFISLNGSPQVGGTWSPSLASGTGIFNPAIDVAGIYTYSFTGANSCDNDSATVTVSISPIPNAGTFTGVQSVCTTTGTFDLFTLLNGNQTGGTWTDSNNQNVSNLVDVSTLIPNSYSFTYTIINSCGTDSEVVELIILPNPVLNLPNISVSSPICSGSNATVSFSNMVDGNYVLNYELTGSNISIQSAPLTILSGVGAFNINAFDIPNIGTTTITFLNIANATTSCGTLLADVSTSFNINPLSTLENTNLTIANTCIGSDATVLISNATGLIDGDYQFNYTIPQATPSTGVTSNITISGGNGQFSIPGLGFTNTGNYSLTIDSIVSITGGCTNLNENATTGFEILSIPDASGATISALNSCLNSSNQVQIIGATNLVDGNYTIDYQLSGVITASLNATISITGGMGVFIIPAVNLINTGIVTVTVSQITNNTTLCGTGLTFVTSTTFEVSTINDPVLVVNGEQFCANENPTIADLAANIVGTDTVLFYNAITGGTPYVNTDLLINGSIYYATLVSASGCESTTRLQITVILNTVDSPTLTTNGNEFCVTDNATLADLSTNIVGNGIVTWYDNITGGNQYANTKTLVDGTIYYATLISSSGCESNPRLPVTVAINQIGDPILNDKGNEFCKTDNPTIAELSANIQGTNSVVWYDSDTNGVAYNASDLLIDGTTYYATLVTSTGCESQHRLLVKVDLNKCNDLLIPDGFSPNNDGVNETFEIKNLAEIYPNYNLEIYNRYGNLLYKGNINTPNWNGTTTESGINLGTSEVPVGVYFYILEFNDGIQKPIQGRVYLSR